MFMERHLSKEAGQQTSVPLPLELDRGPLSAQLHRHADYTNPLGPLEKTRDLRASALVVARDRRWRGNPDLLMVKSV
jgi:hypothetical protein